MKLLKTRRGLIFTLTALAVLVVVGFFWFVLGYTADTWHIFVAGLLNGIWRSWLFPSGWNLLKATPFFWMLVATLFVAIAIIRSLNAQYKTQKTNFDKKAANSQKRFPSYEYLRGFHFEPKFSPRLVKSAVAVVAGCMIVSVATMFMWADWNARHYNEANTYVVEDTGNLPNSLSRIGLANSPQIDIETGILPDSWEKRVASATGATYVMQKTGDSNVNTVLMSETVSYIYNTDGSTGGSWTGIRNGQKRQPIYGISSWAGTGEAVKTCEFKGDFELSKAFDASWGLNLSDDIAQFDPSFMYNTSDMYGYCDGDKPVIVIPGSRIKGLQVQAAQTAYGVMTITGSPSGKAVIDFRDTVKAGDLPGPAYPVKLVQEQRNTLSWSAGRVWPWQPPIGFEETDSESQLGNSTDFLLKSTEDGRLYWVTPLKPRGTDSQTVVAYAIMHADEITSGQLNEQRIYVLNDNDPRTVNFNDLTNAVTQAVAKIDPGFFTGGNENQGNIVEFVPTSSGSWQVFAERGGRAVYRIDITGGTRLQTTVANIDTSENPTPVTDPESTPSGDANCSDAATLSDSQLADCISQLSSELVKRSNTE